MVNHLSNSRDVRKKVIRLIIILSLWLPGWAELPPDEAAQIPESLKSLNIPSGRPQQIPSQTEILFITAGNQFWNRLGGVALRFNKGKIKEDFVYSFFDPFGSDLKSWKQLAQLSPTSQNTRQVLKLPFDVFKTMLHKNNLALEGIKLQIEDTLQTHLLNQLESLLQNPNPSPNPKASPKASITHLVFPQLTVQAQHIVDEVLRKTLRQIVLQLEASTPPLSLHSYRTYMRSYYHPQPLHMFLYDIFLNYKADFPVQNFDILRFPDQLQATIVNVSLASEAGNRKIALKDQANLGMQTSYLKSQQTVGKPLSKSKAILVFLYFLFPTIILFALLILKLNPDSPHLAYLCNSFTIMATIIWGGVAGCLSLAMIGFWLFSANSILHQNILLTLFWPTDILMSLGLIISLVKQQWRSIIQQTIINYLLIHVMAIFLLVGILFSLPYLQKTEYIIFYASSILIMLFLSFNSIQRLNARLA